MEFNWNEIGSLIGELGPLGIVVFLLGYLGKLVISNESRHQSEIARINAAHDAELTELRTDISELRRDLDHLRTMLDDERRLRFQAENEAQMLRIQLVGGLRSEES